MRLIRFCDTDGTVHSGIDNADGTARLLARSVLDSLEPVGGRAVTFDRVLAPLDPPVVMGIGMNYQAHAAEQGKAAPERPMMFMKNPSAVCGPSDTIVIPKVCQDRDQTDYECELGVIIGRPCRDVAAADALDYVLGYVAANDVSARWWQKEAGGGQFCRGKSFDTFCPIGPCVVTTDEIPDPQCLRLATRINGQTMQESTTADMIFPVAELIAFLSQGTTLVPGTLILTGTPSGVGFARSTPVWLKDGDLVEVEVERIGILRNRVALEC